MVNNSTHGHSSDTSKQIDETDPLPPSLPLLHTHTHTLSLSLSSLALSLSPPLGKETKQRCVRTDWRFGCTEKNKKKNKLKQYDEEDEEMRRQYNLYKTAS